MNNLDRAFPPTPDCVREAIQAGCRRGQRRRRARRALYACTAVAAALLVTWFALAAAVNRT